MRQGIDRPRRTGLVRRPVVVLPPVQRASALARWQLDPRFVPYVEKLIEEARRRGIQLSIVDGRRSFRQQQNLLRRFRAGDSSVFKAARPGWSFHEYGLAVDVRASPPGGLAGAGAIAEALGLRWGGRFGDPVHFDLGSKITIAQARREAGIA